MTPIEILIFYIVFRLKQFVCDFMLQTDWMAVCKGMPGWEGYRALLSHAAVHGAGTYVIMLMFAPSFWWLGPVDFIVHGLVDRLKGILTYQKGWKYTDRLFWWSFGLDQEAHNLTHIAYLAIVVAAMGGVAAS